MGETYDGIKKKLWLRHDPYASFPERLIERDPSGWNSQHEYLASTIDTLRPKIVIEVGVWKGGSTLFMADRMRRLGLDSTVISVDTWLGSWDHWRDENLKRELAFLHGYPSLFYKFMANVVAQELQGYVIPLPLDSVNAREVIGECGIVADMIHIDAGHDYAAVCSDLAQWWQALRDGGVLIFDDYDPNGGAWPGVKRAVEEFCATHPVAGFEAVSAKCRFVKLPAAMAHGSSGLAVRAPV